jgi:hypothetical protein
VTVNLHEADWIEAAKDAFMRTYCAAPTLTVPGVMEFHGDPDHDEPETGEYIVCNHAERVAFFDAIKTVYDIAMAQAKYVQTLEARIAALEGGL